MNLSALQKIATEQTDALKGLAETMQGQNFFEIGLNLNSVAESISAALEPMKAVGELVPALDQLVVTLESRHDLPGASSPRLTPEQLVTSLADQLSHGLIDPWTFKSAYMAVYPQELPADLLHRLVELLGAQKLSNDLFRAAYDAVQAAQPPETAGGGAGAAAAGVVKVVQDPTLIAQIDELRRANEELSVQISMSKTGKHDDVKIEELQSIIEELQRKLEQRESEFADIIAAKDRELQETQELMASRWEEYNARYDELHDSLQKRDELMAEKESELVRKESENLQLKTQMEELRDQTKDMVSEMQKQLSAAAKPKEEKQSGFFDAAPGPQTKLFDQGGARPLFQPQSPAAVPEQGAAPAQPAVPQQPQPQPQMHQQPQPQMPPPPPPTPVGQPQTASGQQAIPRPAAPTSPFLTGGSYGSGVRAQVFEVIVRQALAGAPWRDICAGPMSVNNITAEEVEAEVKRRQALLGKK
jgi:hypothetical protein